MNEQQPELALRASVTLTWATAAGEAVRELLRLHAELRANGYITDADGDLLQGLVSTAEIAA
jgi:hypothetical protein